MDTLEVWGEAAAFKDERGKPAMWFHGTDVTEPFNVFTRWEDMSIGFHLGTREAANSRLEQIAAHGFGCDDDVSQVVIPVYCRASRPLRLNDLLTWQQDDLADALVHAGVINDEEYEFIVDSCSAEMIFAAVEEAGFDCISYMNGVECGGESAESIMVWRSELLKSPYAAYFDREDPRLLPQVETAVDDLRRWEQIGQLIDDEKKALLEYRESMSAKPAA